MMMEAGDDQAGKKVPTFEKNWRAARRKVTGGKCRRHVQKGRFSIARIKGATKAMLLSAELLSEAEPRNERPFSSSSFLSRRSSVDV